MDSSTRRQVWVLLALIAVDCLLKIAAFHSLPANRPIHECFICIVLRLNASNLGGAAHALMASHGLHLLVGAGVFSVLLGAALLIAAARRSLTRQWIGVSVLVALLLSGALLPLVSRVPGSFLVPVARASVVGLWIVIWVLATSPLWKLGALLWTTAGVANLLSLTYPPYHIVDYLWSTPMNNLIGIGVFNIADVFWLLGYLVFAVAMISSVVRLVFGKTPTERQAM